MFFGEFCLTSRIFLVSVLLSASVERCFVSRNVSGMFSLFFDSLRHRFIHPPYSLSIFIHITPKKKLSHLSLKLNLQGLNLDPKMITDLTSSVTSQEGVTKVNNIYIANTTLNTEHTSNYTHYTLHTAHYISCTLHTLPTLHSEHTT